MKSMTVRNIPTEVHEAVKLSAVEHGCSAGQEVRVTLSAAARRPHLADVLLGVGAQLQDLSVDIFDAPRNKRTIRLASFGRWLCWIRTSLANL